MGSIEHLATLINDGNVVEQLVDARESLKRTPAANASGKSAVLHRSLHHNPIRVKSAKGNYLHLRNGQSIFDATGGAAVSCVGHGHDRIQAAVTVQMGQVSYCHSLFYATEAAEELATLLTDATDGEMVRAFFVSSGSEAIEAALKLARQYHVEKSPSEPQRSHFISRQQSYHGTTLGALTAGGHVARRALFEPMLSINNSRVSPCYSYRSKVAGSENLMAYVERLAAELDGEFQRIGPHRVAAFIAEPVVGAALGCVGPVLGYFKAMRRVCDKYGALLILDEVMCGVGRIGPEPSKRWPNPMYAWQDPLIGVIPDIVTLGKGLGGGYMPIAAMLAGKKVISVLERGTGVFNHGQTYQGHPLACSAALEVQKVIRDESLIANVRDQGTLLGRLLNDKLAAHPAVGNIRGKGFFWGIEFVRNKTTKQPFEPKEAVAMGIHELGMQPPYNISLYPGTGSVDGRSGDHVLIAPAYNCTESDINHVVHVTVSVINDFFKQRYGISVPSKLGGRNYNGRLPQVAS